MKKNKKLYTTAIAAALASSALVTVVPAQAETVKFKDVDSSSIFYEYITNLANRGIISGYGDDTFRPTLEVRRDHAAKIMAGILDLNTTKVVDPKFTDVPANHPHYSEIAAMKEAGIISGDGYGKYLPEKSLTRGEMAKIIANAFKLEVPANSTTPFTDVKGNMFEQYITALYVNGVTNGVGNNKYDPSGVVTREQLAKFVVLAEEIAGEMVSKETKVDSIDGDTIVVNGEVLVLTEELKAVFNEKNAAALKDAKVELVIRYKDAPVASLAPVANNRQGEVVGIKAVELPNANTTFNASGFEIPTVSVTANGVTISNVAVSTFTVAKGAAVTLENVVAEAVTVHGTLTLGEGSKVAEVIVTGDAKITVNKGVTLEKVTLPEGKKLEDVIANYNEVKDQLKDVKVEEVKPGGSTPTTPSITPPPAAQTTQAVNAFFVKMKAAMENVDKAVAQVKVTATEVGANQFEVVINHVEGTTITKNDILDQKQKVLDEFTNKGLRVEVKEVVVGGEKYTPKQFESSIATPFFEFAPALGQDLGLTFTEAANLLQADNTVNVITLLTKQQYKSATPVIVTLTNGDTFTVITELNVAK